MSLYVPPDWRAHVQQAAAERATKDIAMIQHETAITWASRAMASMAAYETGGRIQDLLDAEEYAHEALEHAALAGSSTFEMVEGALAQVRDSLSRPH